VKIVVIGFNARGEKVSEADAIQFFGKRPSAVAELSENLPMLCLKSRCSTAMPPVVRIGFALPYDRPPANLGCALSDPLGFRGLRIAAKNKDNR
jgi:hypothetical protein